MVRALLIDPEARSVTEVDTSGDWSSILDLFGNPCRIALAAPAFVRYPDGGADVVYFDDAQDECLEKPTAWYQIDADLDLRLSPPRAYRALVIGCDYRKPRPVDDDNRAVAFYPELVGNGYCGGEHCDARISVEALTKRVTFTRRVFQDYEEDADGWIRLIATIVN